MPPRKKATQTRTQSGANTTSPSACTAPSVSFPVLSSKTELASSVLLPDQIITFDNVLTAAECKQFTKLIDNLPLELTPPKKRGEADRVNYRFSVKSTDFAMKLQELLAPHLPSFPYPSSSRMRNTDARRSPHSFNSNIRMYKYTSEQYFGAHYDDSVRDADTGAKSEWTLLIYLSGVEDGVQGGETIFYNESKGKPREEIIAPLTRGTALLHRHGNECMLHEGSLVKSGTKHEQARFILSVGERLSPDSVYVRRIQIVEDRLATLLAPRKGLTVEFLLGRRRTLTEVPRMPMVPDQVLCPV